MKTKCDYCGLEKKEAEPGSCWLHWKCPGELEYGPEHNALTHLITQLGRDLNFCCAGHLVKYVAAQLGVQRKLVEHDWQAPLCNCPACLKKRTDPSVVEAK